MKPETKINMLIASYHSKYWKSELREWINVAEKWLNNNHIDFDKNKIVVGRLENLRKIECFKEIHSECLGYTTFGENGKICIICDSFERRHKQRSSLVKLMTRKYGISLTQSDCTHVIFVLFHEIGHYVIEKWINASNDVKTRRKLLQKIFDRTSKIYQDGNSYEYAADWFALYSLNSKLVYETNPFVYEFFQTRLGIGTLY